MWKTLRLDIERRDVLDQFKKNRKSYCEEASSEEEGGESETVDAEEESDSKEWVEKSADKVDRKKSKGTDKKGSSEDINKKRKKTRMRRRIKL